MKVKLSGLYPHGELQSMMQSAVLDAPVELSDRVARIVYPLGIVDHDYYLTKDAILRSLPHSEVATEAVRLHETITNNNARERVLIRQIRDRQRDELQCACSEMEALVLTDGPFMSDRLMNYMSAARRARRLCKFREDAQITRAQLEKDAHAAISKFLCNEIDLFLMDKTDYAILPARHVDHGKLLDDLRRKARFSVEPTEEEIAFLGHESQEDHYEQEDDYEDDGERVPDENQYARF